MSVLIPTERPQGSHPLADKGTRFTQHLIDSVLFLVLFVSYVFFMEDQFGVYERGELLRPLGGFLLYMGFYAGSEAIFAKTPGKFFVGTRVVDASGNRPGSMRIVLRALCRLIPFDDISFLLDQRGWHDQLSGTYVIKEE